MKVSGGTVNQMAKESYFLRMVTHMKVNGRRIKQTVTVYSLLRLSHILGSGSMICTMAKEKKNGRMDLNFKDSMLRVKRTVSVYINGLIQQCIQVIGPITR